MAETNDVQTYFAFWQIIRYIAIGLVTVVGALFSVIATWSLWFIGKYRGQHELMYLDFVANNGDKAKELKEKQKDEYKEIIEAIKELKHNVNQQRQEFLNLKIQISSKI